MSIEIEILSGGASWPLARPLFDAIWPPEVVATLPWADVTFAHPELRVLIATPDGVACHVGLYRRQASWNGRKVRIGGIGGVLTRDDCRNLGYATLALSAAIQTLKDEASTDFALLFCEPKNAAFYDSRGWAPFGGEVYCEQPSGRIRFEAIAPHVFDLRRKPRDGVIDLCGLPW